VCVCRKSVMQEPVLYIFYDYHKLFTLYLNNLERKARQEKQPGIRHKRIYVK